MADTIDEAPGMTDHPQSHEEEPIPATNTENPVSEPVADQPEEAAVEHKPYQQLMIYRWEMIDSMLSQAWVGLRNSILELDKLSDRRQFNQQQFKMTGAILSVTEAIHRAHNGFMDKPPEPETALYVPPEKKIVIAR